MMIKVGVWSRFFGKSKKKLFHFSTSYSVENYLLKFCDEIRNRKKVIAVCVGTSRSARSAAAERRAPAVNPHSEKSRFPLFTYTPYTCKGLTISSQFYLEEAEQDSGVLLYGPGIAD